MADFDFENLDLYKKTLNFVNVVYNLIGNFPQSEQYGLTNQFRRAANSIALNLGEGYGDSIPQSLRYLRISRASIRECVVCITIAHMRNYISDLENIETRNLLVELSKMSAGYKRFLERQLQD